MMLQLGMAVMCAAIGWILAFKRTVPLTEAFPADLSPWYLRAILVGGAIVGCMTIARFLTYQPSRGMRIGFANFVLVYAVMLIGVCGVFFFWHGGDLANLAAFQEFAGRMIQMYGAATFVSFAAFLACELLMARL